MLQPETKENKVSTLFLVLMVSVTSLIWAGGVYFYDFPQLFEQVLITEFKVSTFEVGFLYSIASTPAIILIPLGSWMISHIGISMGAIVFTTMMFVGIFFCFLGVKTGNYDLIIIGRAIFGVGYETCYVVQASCTEKWFSGRFLTLAFAINRSCCYLFASLAAYFQPIIFISSRSLETSLFYYTVVSSSCCVFGFIYYFLDRKYEHNLKDDEPEMNEEGEEVQSRTSNEDEQKFYLSDLKNISLHSWLLLMLFAVFSNCLYQFSNFGTDCFVNRFGFDYIAAKDRMSLIPILHMIFIPLFGSIMSVVGRKELFLLAGTVIGVVSYGLMATLADDANNLAVLALVGCSAFFSILNSGFWGSFALTLPKAACGPMFGICLAIQNIFLAIFPPIFSYFNQDRTPEAYQNCLYLLIGLCGCCFLIALAIAIIDLKGDRVLHLPENSQKVKDFRDRINREFILKRNKGTVNDEYKSLKSKGDLPSTMPDSSENEDLGVIRV